MIVVFPLSLMFLSRECRYTVSGCFTLKSQTWKLVSSERQGNAYTTPHAFETFDLDGRFQDFR